MRYLRRYCLLLCALAMCVGLFSTTAHADTAPKYKAHIYAWNSGIGLAGQESFYDGSTDSKSADSAWFTLTDVTRYLKFEITLTDDSDYILFEGGKKYEYRIDNLMLSLALCHREAGALGDIDPSILYLQNTYMHYTDGTKQNISFTLSYNDKTETYSLLANVSPTKDVKSIYTEAVSAFKPTADSGWLGEPVCICSGFGARTAYPLQFKVTEERKELDFLNRISNFTYNLYNKTVEGFNKVTDGVTNVVNSITELPTKLWDKISEGLKNLFVPSEESMSAYKDKWDSLLSDRLGAVYQVVSITLESWTEVMEADETDTIEFPEATLNFSGTSFSFGGYQVKIVPDGFSGLVTAIKAIVAIVCTVMVVNGLRKRYDEVMGVEQ